MPAREATSDSTSAVDVTMKMMRRTRKTGVGGVLLIWAPTLWPPPSPSSLPALPSSIWTLMPTVASALRRGGLGPRRDRHHGRLPLHALAERGQELLREQAVVHGDDADARDEIVVGDDRIDRDEQAGRRRAQRRRDSLRHDLEAACAGHGHRLKGLQDADDGPEQADERRG